MFSFLDFIFFLFITALINIIYLVYNSSSYTFNDSILIKLLNKQDERIKILEKENKMLNAKIYANMAELTLYQAMLTASQESLKNIENILIEKKSV